MTGYILSVVLTSMTCTDSGHVMYNTAIPVMKFEDTKLDRLLPMSAKPVGDHPFKTSACLRGEDGCPLVPMVKRSQHIRIKNPLHKHFAGMPMGRGQKF